MGICVNPASDTSIPTMTSAKLMLVGALVAIFLLSFDFVESQCLNCEAPNGPYCCKTSFSGNCCEYPLDRSDGHNTMPTGRSPLSPLAKQLKQLEGRQWPKDPTVRPPVV